MNEISQKLTDFFAQYLPITDFMGMGVESYDGKTLVLTAPLGPNINDKKTAFGGSLYNVAVMACWGLAYLKTQEKGIQCNQVVADGAMKYIAPVTGKIRAVCESPSDEEMAAFFEKFAQRGRASIQLSATITNDGDAPNQDNRTAVTFSGKYAILTE